MIRARLAVAAMATLVAVAALAAVSPADAAKHCTNTVLTRKNSGRSLFMRRCDRVTIRLRQASDGGYSWRIVRHPDSSILKLLENRTVLPHHPNHRVGGYTLRVVIYRAVGAGSTHVKLVESRSFERRSQVAVFRLAAHVR